MTARAIVAVTVIVALSLVAASCGLGGQEISTPETSTTTRPGDTVVLVTTSAVPGSPAPRSDQDRSGASSRTLSSAPDDDPTTFYVSAEVGNDGNDGQTAEAPWHSLQLGLDRMQPGQTLFVMNGEYSEQKEPTIAHYVMEVDGAPDAWIRLAPASGHNPVFAATSGNALSIRANYIEVVGFTVRGRGYGVDNAYGWGMVIRGAHHVRLVGNTVSGMPVGGLTAIESSNVEIIGNEVFENSFWGTEQGSGISIWHSIDHGLGPADDGYHDRVIGNIIYRNENKVFSRWEPDENVISDGNGIIIDESKDTGYEGRTLVANNVAFDNGGRGILVTKASRVDVMFNTTYHNGRTEILQSGPVELAASRSDDVRFLNNLTWSRPGVPGIKVTWANDIVLGGNVFVTDSPSGVETDLDLVMEGDPGLVSPGIDREMVDFRPRPGSIVIDRAIDVDPKLTFDANGRQRPLVGLDVGAFELAP